MLAVAIVATVGVYLPSIRGEFQLDDWSSIQTNWNLRDLGRVATGFSLVELLGPDRPVTGATFALDFAIGGLEPLAFHVTSVVMHLAAVLLAFAFVRELLRRAGHARPAPVALAVAVIFSLHPLQTQAVCYVAQRAEVLSSALCLGSLLLFLRAWDGWPRWRGAAWAAGATAVMLLGVGAKTIAVTVPAALLLWAVAFGEAEGGRPPLARRVGRALALGAGAWAIAAASVARNLLTLQPESGVGFGARTIGAWQYLLTELRAHWLYARLVAWPAGQTVDHPFEASPEVPDAATLAAGLATVALVAVAVYLLRRAERGGDGAPAARAAAFGIGWWYLLLSPTSSFIPIVDLTFEHRAYLATLGAILAIVVAVDRLASTRADPRRALGVAAGAGVVACVALGAATAVRAQVWSTEISLWEDAVLKNPEGYRPADSYAYALSAKGRRIEANRAFARALELAKTPGQTAGTARNLASFLLTGGQVDAALSAIDLGLAAVPFDWELRVLRAYVLTSRQRLDEALWEARAALRVAPQSPVPHDMMGLVLMAQKAPDEALGYFQRAVAIDPGERAYRHHAVIALDALGRRAEACSAWLGAKGLPGTTEPGAAAVARRLGCDR